MSIERDDEHNWRRTTGYLSSVIFISPLCVLNFSNLARKEKKNGRTRLRVVMTTGRTRPSRVEDCCRAERGEERERWRKQMRERRAVILDQQKTHLVILPHCLTIEGGHHWGMKQWLSMV